MIYYFQKQKYTKCLTLRTLFLNKCYGVRELKIPVGLYAVSLARSSPKDAASIPNALRRICKSLKIRED